MNTALYCQIGPQAPELIRILPFGEVVLGDGRDPFWVTQESLGKIMEAWNLRGNDMVIDYEHQTVTGQEAPAAGWVKALFPASDGLWARVEWTDRARVYLEKKEYRYFSPVVQLGEGRLVVDLLHVALTNFPALTNLVPLVLQNQRSMDSDQVTGIRGTEQREGGREKLIAEECIEIRGESMIIEELRTIFGLQDEATEAHILTLAADLVKNKKQQLPALPLEIIKSLGLKEDDSAANALQRIESLKAEVENVAVIREELISLKKEQSIQKAEQLIQEALSSKRTTPAELDLADGRLRRLAQDDPDFFRELILSRLENWAVPGHIGGGSQSLLALNSEERTICQTFGIMPEEFLKNKVTFEKGE